MKYTVYISTPAGDAVIRVHHARSAERAIKIAVYQLYRARMIEGLPAETDNFTALQMHDYLTGPAYDGAIDVRATETEKHHLLLQERFFWNPPVKVKPVVSVSKVRELFDYYWQDGACNESYGDPENGPSPDDIVYPDIPKQVWKAAYGAYRMMVQGLDPFQPHPKDTYDYGTVPY